jgi:hypothetical protein
MTSRRDHDRKYSDIDAYSFTAEHLAAHLAGTATYAATLGAAGTARAGCKDYDSADEAEILAALEQAHQKGITAAAIVMPGAAGEHTGGHLWVFYDRPYAESDIRAQLRTIRRSGKGEDYPSGNPIRLPCSYHQIKKTRGILILQDGRRFNLDTQLTAGIDALLSLPRNGKPEPAPAGDARISGAAWGDAYKPEQWENLPDGGPLWHSPYVAAAAKRPDRENLAKLLRGDRVTVIKKDDTRDDSDSAQVAALAFNLLSADVCKPQARAIADYLYPQLRPSKTREHYRAHFDVELERYTPKHYRPTEIRFLGTVTSTAPQPLLAAEYRPEPKSRARKDRPQRVTGASGYLAWLRTQVDPQSDSVMLSQSQCAARLGCCVRTIKRYEHTLGKQIERRVFAQRQAGCLFILSPDVVPTFPADVVIADTGIAQQSAENAEPAIVQVEHTAPLVPEAQIAPPAWVGRAELADWTKEAFDAYPGRANFRKVQKHVEMLADGRRFNSATLKRLYAEELAHRRYAKQDARELEKARALFGKALSNKSRAIAGAAAQMHRSGDKRAPIWDRRAGIYAQVEAERQQQEAERIARIGYSLTEQAEMLDLVDQVRPERRKVGRAAASAACVPPTRRRRAPRLASVVTTP